MKFTQHIKSGKSVDCQTCIEAFNLRQFSVESVMEYDSEVYM